MKRLLRRLLMALAGALVLLLVILAGAFAFAQTRAGKAWIAGLVADQLGREAEVAGLDGLLPFDIRLGRLRLRDAAGVWLEVDDARVELSPGALLTGEIQVRQVGARRVAVNRLPPSPTPEPAPEEPFSLPKAPELPETLPRVNVERLFVDRLELGRPVLGEAARFALAGHAATAPDGRRAEAALSLRRTDAPTAELQAAAGLDLAAGSLSLDIQGSETGGLLAAATGRPEAGALRLSLKGEGPLDRWQGRLAAEAERLAKLDLNLDLALADAPHIAAEGSLTAAAGVLPPAVADLIGERADLAIRAGELSPQRFALQELRVQAASLVLEGQGTADLAADTIAGTLALNLPDLGRFAGLAGTPLAGKGTLRLDAKGAARQPALRLTLDAENLAAASVALARLGGAFDLDLLDPLGEGPIGLRVTGGAETAGLMLDGRQLGQDGRIALELAGELPPTGEARVRSLALRSSLFEVTGRAAVDRDRLAGSARLDAAVPELAAVLQALAPDAASPLDGALQLGADVTLAEGAKRIEAVLAGGGSGLRGLPPGVQELIGASPTLQGRVAVAPGRAIAVPSLVVEGAAARLEGDPRYGLADRSLGGTLRLSLPDLGRLQPVVGQEAAGKATLQADLGGTIEQPAVTLTGRGEGIGIAGQAFDRVTLDARAQGPTDALGGSARLALTRGAQEVALAIDYRLAGQQLTLSDLSLTGPGMRLDGEVALGLDGPLVRGRLQGAVRDLAALAPWTGQNLAGRADLDLQLTTPAGRQDVRLLLQADGVAGDFGALRTARLDATLQDALGRRGIAAGLRAQGLAAADLNVEEAALDLAGALADLAVTAQARGRQADRPFYLRAAAEIEALDADKALRLTMLAGTLAGQPVRLAQPLTARLEGDALAIDRLDLRLGPAKLAGSLSLDGGRVRADAALTALPLALVEQLGGPPLAGTAEARLSLTGSTRSPMGNLQVRIPDLGRGTGATVDAALDAGLRDGRLDAALRLGGLGAEPLTAQARLPLTLRLEPFAFALDQGAVLDGRIAGEAELARLARLLALDGVQLGGRLQLALDLGGTLRRPAVNGRLDLVQGAVQEVASGIALRDLRLRARAAGSRVTIEELSARDRAEGRLAGRGNLVLLPDGGMTYDLVLNLASTRVLENSLGLVVLSGDLGFAGDLAAAAARGRLRVEHADIAIPDETGVSVPVIEVEERGAGGQIVAAPAMGGGPPFDLRLDIAVDAPARLFVHGRGLESEWGGALKLRGSVQDLRITGDLEVRRGFIDLLDRRFTIEEGRIAFVGSNPPVPMIDLRATARTAEIEGVVRLRGPATDPELLLTSDPELPQDEILSRLLFGRSVARITPVQGLRLAAAVRQLQGGGGIYSLLGAMRRGLGVDTLDIDGGAEPGESQVRAGKYLSDNVYLELERGMAEGSSKARVRIELTPNLSVGTEVNERSQTGVGVQWRYDY